MDHANARPTNPSLTVWIGRTESCLLSVLIIFTTVLPLFYAPQATWSETEPIGSDLISHYWTLFLVRNIGLSEWTWPIWNPYNLAGEPLLVHYFPLPFLLMALASVAAPLAVTLKAGSFLPMSFIPLASAFAAAELSSLYSPASGKRLHAAAIGALAATSMVYNDGSALWGGNIKSLLAGQFCHAFGLIFLILSFGWLCREIRLQRRPLVSSLMLTATIASHAYAAMAIPGMCIALILTAKGRADFFRITRTILHSAALTTAATLWVVVPMLDNAAWTTPVKGSSTTAGFLAIFPATFEASFYAMVAACAFLLFRPLRSGTHTRPVLVCMIVMAWQTVLYRAYPSLGLIDFRALPQLQIFFVVMVSVLIYAAISRLSVTVRMPALLVYASAQFGGLTTPIATEMPLFESLFRGYPSLSVYDELASLSFAEAGTLSDGRIASDRPVDAPGGVRLFENTHLLMGRPAMSGLYIQANPLGAIVDLVESRLTKKLACQLLETYGCEPQMVWKSLPLLRLLAVDTVFFGKSSLTDAQMNFLRSHPDIRELVPSFPWYVMRLKDRASYVEVPAVPSLVVAKQNWRETFYRWAATYDGSQPILIAGGDPLTDADTASAAVAPKDTCEPYTAVEFNRITLRTNCPGRFHLLKFAYHDAWTADSNDKLLLASPGLLGVVPSRTKVTLSFGAKASWKVSYWISALALLWILVCLWRYPAQPLK